MSRITTATRLGLAVLLATALDAPTAARAPGFLEVGAEPDRLPPGVPVRLTGSLPDDGSTSTAITVRVTPPPGTNPPLPPRMDLAAQLNADRQFSVEFTRTARLGRYEVEVASPSGRFTAKGHFDVVADDDLAEEIAAEHRGLIDDTDHLLQVLDQLADRVPTPARRAHLKKGIAQLRSHLTQQVDELRVLAGLPKSRTYHHEMRQWMRDSGRTRPPARAADAKASDICETLEQLTEGFNLASALFNLIGKPVEIVAGYFKDFAASASDQFLAQQLVKQGPNLIEIKHATTTLKKRTVALKALPGVAFDLGAYVTGFVFDAYCATLTGPIDGGLKARFSNAGREWWNYTEKIGGRLILRFPKDVPAGSAIPIKGEFLGNGYGFDAAWNRIGALTPELLATTGTLYLHGVVTPSGTLPSLRPNFEGKAVASLSPKAFFVPVSGTMVRDEIELRLGTPRVDFEHSTSATAYYFLLSPLNMRIEFDTVDLPYKGAHTIISRSGRDQPLRMRLRRDPNRTSPNDIAEATFSAKKEGHSGGDFAEGWYSLKVKVCSGTC